MTRGKEQNRLLFRRDEGLLCSSITSPCNERPRAGHLQPVCLYIDLAIPGRAALDTPIEFAVFTSPHAKTSLAFRYTLLIGSHTSLPRQGKPVMHSRGHIRPRHSERSMC